jgi:hypothetical protein
MRFYHMGYRELLDLPITVFWGFNKNIDRLRAEEDYRFATVAIYAASGEKVNDLMQDLREQMGTFIVIDEGEAAMQKANAERDAEGLKALMALNRGV